MAPSDRPFAYFSRSIGFVVFVTLLAAGCRYETIWSGAVHDSSGQYIRLAADEPLCGCLRLRNLSSQDILLRSLLKGEELGQQRFAAGAVADIRFDWAGPLGSDVYRLEGWNAQGARVPLGGAVEIEDNGWPWRVCGQASCSYGTLMMNAGEQRR